MMQLKCNTKNCQHNLKCHCNATLITVDEKANCVSKIKRNGGALEQTFANIEASEEMANATPSIVQCDAVCVYNDSGRCSATSLLVSDILLKSKCATRIKP